MAKTTRAENRRSIESYEHRDKERLNNPPAGLVTPDTDPDAGQKKKTYAYDPHLDPQLVWAGKAEHTSFEVPTVSLHVHERIDPRTIIEAVRKLPSPQPSPRGKGGGEENPLPSGEGGRRPGEGIQLPLFEIERKEPLRSAIEFYRHAHGWANRLIAGDSLLVMNSLLEKEGMAGKVQMIYIDPPYGIKYGSNFQPFVNKRDVKDGKDEDLTAEPEQIKAFRDTWELGIHSYLTYLRDRLLLARELLTESGSIFVQISDENVHHVRELMDEVFGAGNFCAIIPFRTTISQPSRLAATVCDLLIWYGKNKVETKFRRLYRPKVPGEAGATTYAHIELPNGRRRRLTPEEQAQMNRLPEGSRVFSTTALTQRGTRLQTTHEGLERLRVAGRVVEVGDELRYVRYLEDFPAVEVVNLWDDTITGSFTEPKVYAVQTNTKVIARCLLMTTDPGDLVFDPTCGSGTTAYVAEQWGRRWITCDTSRVALTLARQRLMTAVFDYYELAHPEEGVGSGFKYKTVPHVTLKSIANNPEIDGIHARWQARLEPIREQLNAVLSGQWLVDSGRKEAFKPLEEWEIPHERLGHWPLSTDHLLKEWWNLRRKRQAEIDAAIARHAPQETLYDQPFVDRKRTRVSGPFTVEAVPAPAVKSVDELLPSPIGRGVRGEGKKPLPRHLLDFARQLRKDQTDAERLMWSLLRDRRLAGFKFRRQHPVEPYILDFYCHEARLAVELDGGQHNEPDERARDARRTAFLEDQGIRVLRFWNNEVFTNTEGVLQAIYDALTLALSQREFMADASIARSGETLRQAEWRDELLRAGIRGKAGQYIRFVRLEPLPGCRWLHADGEVVDSEQGIVDSKKQANHAKLSTDHYSLSTNRIVVSFGPEHAPLEQRQVQRAWEEAQQLVPKPKLLIFAAFQFDPEAAKDIDEMKPELAGMQFLKVQMNADLLTDDLKKKRASNESFWLIGQPDVVVDSEQWIVNSRKEALAPYDIVAKLSGLDSLAEINGLGRDDLSVFIAIAQRRDLWDAFATDAGSGVDTGKHRGRTGAARDGGVPAFPGRCAGLPGRIGDAADFVRELEVLSDRDRRKRIDGLRGNREIADRARQIASSLTGPLSTTHYSQVTIHGFDYYNTKTGGIESGGADKIAVWLLDTDYDGRSLYPRQVFFPMAGEKEGWARLARNLKAEIDEERIEAYRGTVSLPFEAGEHQRIAVKIVDDRGIESLKVMEVK